MPRTDTELSVEHRRSMGQMKGYIPLIKMLFGQALGSLCLSLLIPALALADTYTIRITGQSGPVEGVQIFGNHGINYLPGRFTDSSGQWSFNTADLLGSDYVIAFSKPADGYRFSPSELRPSLSACPGLICNVQAIQDGSPGAIIHWRVVSNGGDSYPGLPVVVLDADYPCPKVSDQDGYVLFSVRSRLSGCNNNDADISNDAYQVVVQQPAHFACNFNTPLPKGFKACPYGADFWGN